LGLFFGLISSLLLCVSCGGGKPSTVSQPVTGTGLTTVSLGSDVTVRVPAGALPDGGTVNVVKASGKDAAPGELDGGKAVGSAFKIDVGDQKLSKPITLEIAFDPKSLPKDMPKDAVFLAYYDEEKQAWVPVGGQVDSTRNVISIQTDHLSWWNPFSWDWQAWIAVMEKGLSGKLTDWVQGVQLLTTECKKSGQSVTIDESKANNVLQGCVTKDDSSKPELRVVNVKSFYLGVSPAPGGPGYPQATLLGPGDAASFTASTSDTPPAVVYADFTEEAMWRFVVGLVAEMLPSGNLIPNDGLAFIADGLKSTMSAKEASDKLDTGDSRGAAESVYELITGDSFIEAFAKLAADYGQKNSVDMMTKWTEAGVKEVLTGVAAVDVIVSATDFVANYVLNNHSAVAFTWARQDTSRSLTPADLGSLALSLADYGERYSGFQLDAGSGLIPPQYVLEMSCGQVTEADLTRVGYLATYASSYTNPSSQSGNADYISVASALQLFATSGGAAEVIDTDLQRFPQNVGRTCEQITTVSVQQFDVPKVGDQSWGMIILETMPDGHNVTFTNVEFRHGRIVASVDVDRLTGGDSRQEVIGLALKLDQRISDVLQRGAQ
jgi:hypothetical protein